MADPEHQSTLGMLFAPLRTKPWLGLVFLGFLAAGAAIGLVAFPEQWGIPLQLGFGLLLGVGAMLSLYLPRMIATDYDE